MANPNIVNVARILGNTVTGTLVSSNTVWLTNPASSGAIYKINSMTLANIDGIANTDISIIIKNAGANSFFLKTAVLPADASLVAIDKNNGFYLLENSSVGGNAGANSAAAYTISFEQLYDS